MNASQECKLLSIMRLSSYHTPKGETEQNLGLMRLIDQRFPKTPFFGDRRMTLHLLRGLRVERPNQIWCSETSPIRCRRNIPVQAP